MLFKYADYTYDELKVAVNTRANEYEAIKFIGDKEKRKKTDRKNKKLLVSVKKAEREYNKAVKLRQEFVDTYNKFNIQ